MFDIERLISGLSVDKAMDRLGERFLKSLEDETAETFLEALLAFMKIKFMLDPAYRKNIEEFRGRYQFRSRDGGVAVLVKFEDGDMKIREKTSDDVNVTVSFKDGRALMNFLLSANRDILRGLLNNEVVVAGNLNYMYKFGFMANHLQLELTGNLP